MRLYLGLRQKKCCCNEDDAWFGDFVGWCPRSKRLFKSDYFKIYPEIILKLTIAPVINNPRAIRAKLFICPTNAHKLY
jgi:hypothetical protein